MGPRFVRTSEQGIDLLIAREGLRTTAYLDSVGVLTIGVGHTGPEVHPGLQWSPEKCREVFAADIVRFETAVNESVKVGLEQYQFDALVSFAFNVGEGALRSSTLVKRINAGDLDGAALQFNRWHIPPEVTSRRNGERDQFRGVAFEARIV